MRDTETHNPGKDRFFDQQGVHAVSGIENGTLLRRNMRCALLRLLWSRSCNVFLFFDFEYFAEAVTKTLFLTEEGILTFRLKMDAKLNAEVSNTMFGDYGYRGRRGGCRHIPKADMILQKEIEICEQNMWDCYLCPCRRCHGGHRYSIHTV
jgi:hypothetical protein